MGCGAGKQGAGEAPPKGLSQDEKNAIAVQALKDALGLAVNYAIEMGSKADTWTGDFKIGLPIQGQIDDAKKQIKEATLPKVGPIGGGAVPGAEEACGLIDKATGPFEKQFTEAAVAVLSNPGTKSKYTETITSLSVNEAITLCRTGGAGACVQYLDKSCAGAIKASMAPVVDGIMESHPLTNAWKDFIDQFNKAIALVKTATAGKVDIKPIEFDLNGYVLEQTIKGIKTLMLQKEEQIRKAPGEAVSAAIKCVFGGVDPDQWKK